MSADFSASKVWLTPVAVLSVIAIFTATFYAYAERQRLHLGRQLHSRRNRNRCVYHFMIVLTAVMLPKERRSFGRVLGVVGLEVAGFSYAIMFLLLNIYGS